MDINIPTVHSKMVNIKLTKPLLHHIFIKVHIHQSLINLQGAYTHIHLYLLMIITITQLANYLHLCVGLCQANNKVHMYML